MAAIGRPGFVTAEMVKPGATLIDVGINRVTDAAEVESFFPGDAARAATFAKRGSVVVGDIHPAAFAISRALHAGSRRRGRADDCDADAEHGDGGQSCGAVCGMREELSACCASVSPAGWAAVSRPRRGCLRRLERTCCGRMRLAAELMEPGQAVYAAIVGSLWRRPL